VVMVAVVMVAVVMVAVVVLAVAAGPSYPNRLHWRCCSARAVSYWGWSDFAAAA